MAAQVLATGTGALNVDACRIAHASADDLATSLSKNPGRDDVVTSGVYGANRPQQSVNTAGRWPTNLCHDGSPEVLAAFAAFGERHAYGPYRASEGKGRKVNTYGEWDGRGQGPVYADTGTAARFFPALGYGEDELRFHYSGKANKRDRCDSRHPCVKPQSLLRWLARLITPPGGTILDPFAGSGSLGEAALREGFSAVLIEREAEYHADILARLARHRDEAPLLAEVAA